MKSVTVVIGAGSIGQAIVYQSVPYVGTTRAFEFVHAANEVLMGRGV